MDFEELAVLLPCHSLEDFPLYHEGEAAEGLLSAWSALWHPTLIAGANRVPVWHRADDPPGTVTGKVLVIPTVVQSELPAGYAARAKNEAACVVRKQHRREEIVATILAALAREPGPVAREMAGDFHALGCCFLFTELLTRRMRYVSNMDTVHFQNQVIAAAAAAARDDAQAAREHLTSCFDTLAEVRGHYYGVDCHFIDLTLVAATTTGEELRRQLEGPVATNLLVAGDVIDGIARDEPATLEAIRAALEKGTASIAGGPLNEAELPLMTPEAILEQLERGLATYEKHLGRRPQVFGQRRFGLTPNLPQILRKTGFTGALHMALDDGRFPAGNRSKTRWEGMDGTAIEALARVPLDASRPETFLSLPEKLGESMDLDMVATIVFAHWPNQWSPFYEDLRRMSVYTPVLGKFVTLDHYFEKTPSSGSFSRHTPDEYRPPYFQQAIIRRKPDPLSSTVRELQQHVAAKSNQTMQAVATLLHGTDAGPAIGEPQSAIESLAAALGGADPSSPRGMLLFNPLTFARQTEVKLGREGEHDDNVMVEVPGMGFAWVPADEAQAGGKKAAKPMAAEHLLQNDFCEVTISAETGGIYSIHDYRTRGNRLSQQIAFRLPGERQQPGEVWRDPDEQAKYSTMVAESIEVTRSGPVMGEIVSRGNLIDPEGRRLAGFRQATQVWLGSRVIVLDIELDPVEELRADPWNSYCAARFAWSDAGADVRRSVNLGSHATELKRLDAPHFVEIFAEDLRTTILPGGLPYHRRLGMRMLDSLLLVRGETARRFRVGIGIDLPNPAAAALEFIAPVLQVLDVPSPAARSGWLFHVSPRNVVITHLEPLMEDGKAVGFRARLLETQARSGTVTLRTYRPLASAQQIDFQGQSIASLAVEDDQVKLQLSGYEWVEVEGRMK